MKSKIKIVIIILLFFNSLISSSQILKGKVIYKQSITENVIDSKTVNKKDVKYNGMLNFINQSLKSNSGDFEFELKFNRNESYYTMVDKLQSDRNKSYEIAVALSHGNDKVYINTKTKEKLVQKKAYGKQFIIKSNLNDIKWKFHNDTKKIDNYKCFKATTVKTVINIKGIFKKPVIAWYTPEIPLSHGPKGYGNLPGLILELQEDNFNYYVTKLILNPNKKVTIYLPTKGKLVTEKEFEILGDKLSNSFWKDK